MKWTDSEDKRLISLYNKHKKFKPIAVDLKRSVDAVQARFVKIEICPKHTSKYLLSKKDHLADKYNIKKEDFTRYLKYAGIKDGNSKAPIKTKRIATRVEYVDHFDDIDSNDSDCTDDSNDSNDSDTSDDTYIPDSNDSDCTDNSDYTSDSDYSCDTDDSNSSNDSDYENEMFARLLKKSKQDSKNIASIIKYVKSLHNKILNMEKKLKINK
jgi:hypothetical protein